MRDSRRIRPAVELLESMLLLSSIVSDVAIANPQVAIEHSSKLNLLGSLHGSGAVEGFGYSFEGTGHLKGLGNVSFSIGGITMDIPSGFTLSTNKGIIRGSATEQLLMKPSGSSTSYQITGGTGAYAHASGEGVLTVSYTHLKNGKLGISISFD